MVVLTLALVSELLGMDVPEEVFQKLLDAAIAPELFANASSQLLNRQRHEDYLTPDLVELSRKSSLFGTVKLGLSRIFLPRLVLARIYDVPPNSVHIVSCYLRRLRDLVRQYGKTLGKISVGDNSLGPALDDGKTSNELHAWMIRRA
ncbi:MAG: hypothetical protein WBI14_07815 [Anaerolineaceae bacterium]